MWTFAFTNDLKSHALCDDVEMMDVDFDGDAIMDEVDFLEEFDDPMDVDYDFMVWQYT